MRKHRQIALLGFPGVGKSSLAHHFVYQHFSDVYDPNIKTSKIHLVLFSINSFSIQIFNINVISEMNNMIY